MLGGDERDERVLRRERLGPSALGGRALLLRAGRAAVLKCGTQVSKACRCQ